jgi:hypothetical protein
VVEDPHGLEEDGGGGTSVEVVEVVDVVLGGGA